MTTSSTPLTPPQFFVAFDAALTRLQRCPEVDDVGTVRPYDFAAAMIAAVVPYTAGDPVAAIEVTADVLTPHWREFGDAAAREQALQGGAELLAWLEGFDPARAAATN